MARTKFPPPLPSGSIGTDTEGNPVFIRGGTPQEQVQAIDVIASGGTTRDIIRSGSTGGAGGGFISPSVIEEEAKLKREAAERARLQEEIRKRKLQVEIEKRQAEERTKEQRRVEQKKRVERSVSVRERTRDQQIRQEQNQAVFQARKDFQERINQGQSREESLSKLNEEIFNIQREAKEKRSEEGISTPFKVVSGVVGEGGGIIPDTFLEATEETSEVPAAVSTQPSIISQFRPEEQSTFLSRKELDAQENFLQRLGGRLFTSARNIITEGQFITLGGLFEGIEAELPSETKVRTIPTGTTIEDKTLFQTEKTLGDLIKEQEIISGGTQPTSFAVEQAGERIIENKRKELKIEQDKLQAKVEAGTLKVEKANELLEKKREELNIELEKEFDITQKQIIKSRAEKEKLKQISTTNLEGLIRTGVIVGGLFVAPVTTGVIIGLGGGERFIKSTGKAIGGTEVIRAELLEKFGEDISSQELQSKVRKERIKLVGVAGLGLFEVGLGVGISTQAVLREIDAITLRDLQKAKTKFVGIEKLRTDKGSLFKIKGLKETGLARADIQETLPIFKTGEKTFSITGGKASTQVEFFSVVKDRVLKQQFEFTLFGRGELADAIPKLIKKSGGIKTELSLKDFQAGTGTGGIIRKQELRVFADIKGIRFPSGKPKVKIKTEILGKEESKEILTFRFGGISKVDDNFIKVISGKASKGRFNIIDNELKLLVEPKAFGIIKSFKLPDVDKGFTIIQKADIIKTPLSKTFQVQTIKQLEKQVSQLAIPTQAFTEQGITESVSAVSQQALKSGSEVAIAGITEVSTELLDSKFKDQTLGMLKFQDQTKQRFQNLGTFEGRLRSDVLQSEDVAQSSITKSQQAILNKQLQQTRIKQRQQLKILQSPQTKLEQSSALKVLQAQLQSQQQQQRLKTKLLTTFTPSVIVPEFPFKFGLPKGEIPIPPPVIPLRLPGGESISLFAEDVGHDVFIKEKGKFVKKNKATLTKQKAEDLRDYLLDFSISRTGEIRATNKKPQKPIIDVPLGFSLSNQFKFRGFSQRKGKRTDLPEGRVIEKLIYAGDKKSEINELNTARVIADLEKKSKQQRFRNLALESLGLNDLNLSLGKKRKTKLRRRKQEDLLNVVP